MKSVINGETILFVGGHYEVKAPGAGQQVTKYYFAGSARIAQRRYSIPQAMAVEYFLGDHLGSTSITTDANGTKVSEMRYTPWGEVRYSWKDESLITTPAYSMTRWTFTGQYSYVDDPTTPAVEDFGLMFYNARWYDGSLGRFAQADTIIPNPWNPQAWDRYAYALNAPLRFTDPSGQDVDCGIGDSYCTEARQQYYRSNWKESVPGYSSFDEFMQFKDAYEYYQRNPEQTVDDTMGPNGTYEEKDSLAFAGIYSEYVLHEWFSPVTFDQALQEIDKFVASGEPTNDWIMNIILGAGIFAWMSQDEDGGGYGVSSTGRGLETILQLDDVSFMKWARSSKPINSPFSVDEANAIWTRLEHAGVTPVLDTGHSGSAWTGPHINVRGTSIHIPVVPEFEP